MKLLNGKDQPQSGEISLALIDQRNPHNKIPITPFLRSHRLPNFTMGTSCGFQHQGVQTSINLALREEEALSLNNSNGHLGVAQNQINDALKHYAANTEQIRKLLHQGEGYYNLGKYDNALATFENILRQDKYNKSARRWIELINTVKSDYYRNTYDQTRSEILSEVDNDWELKANEFSDSAQLRQGFGTSALNTPNRNSIDAFINNKNGRGFLSNSSNANWATFNFRKKDQNISKLRTDDLGLTHVTHSHQPSFIWTLNQQAIDKSGITLDIPLPKKSGSWKLLTHGFTANGELGQNLDKPVSYTHLTLPTILLV